MAVGPFEQIVGQRKALLTNIVTPAVPEFATINGFGEGCRTATDCRFDQIGKKLTGLFRIMLPILSEAAEFAPPQ